MLKKELTETTSIDSYIKICAKFIKPHQEAELLVDIIYNRLPKVKFLPFDYNWSIKPHFHIVTVALTKLSTIITNLNLIEWTHTNSIRIQSYMYNIYNKLKNGLIAIGCNNPPYKINISTNEDTIIELARQIISMYDNVE